MPSTTTSSVAVNGGGAGGDNDTAPSLPPRTLNAIVGENVKRTLVMFASDTSARIPVDEDR